MKKGFTLPELLIVLALFAYLSSLAIERMSSVPSETYEISMKNDAINAIRQERYTFYKTQSYDDISFEYNKDIKKVEGSEGGSYALSPYNSLSISSKTCSSGKAGFDLEIINSRVKDKLITFDSCVDKKIQEN